MNKNRIQIAISLMLSALIVLIYVQYHWIKGLYVVESNKFEKSMQRSINDIQLKLFYENFLKDNDILNEVSKLNTNSQPGNLLSPAYNYNNHHQFGSEAPGILNDSLPTIESMDKLYSLKRNFLLRLGAMFDQVTKMSLGDINKEVDPILVDSVIKETFQTEGIDPKYHFAITDENHRFIYQSNEAINKLKYLTKYSIPVFYKNTSEPSFVHLIIHRKRSYILKEIQGILIISVLMILVIGGSFYYSLRIIFNQKKLSEIKNDFINNMTHELKTPISTISLALEAMTKFGIKNDEERSTRYLEICMKENKRLSNMVENVLNAAANQKGELKLKIEELNIHELIESIIETSKVSVTNNKGTIDAYLAADNPNLGVDQVHFTNILVNLIDNANKYYREKPEISLETKNDDKNLYIYVKDKGIGLKKEDAKHVFDRFYRVPTGNVHNVKGYGLGLSYVKDVVEKHEGEITVQSEINKGTIFKIKLPYGRES
jgi:two-component system phosphate regulon sensor histidine kinase PhoR